MGVGVFYREKESPFGKLKLSALTATADRDKKIQEKEKWQN